MANGRSATLPNHNRRIKGFASPEGSYANNTYLAENRAKALRDYVKSLYRFEHATFSVDFEPEDWEGLEKRLEEMNLPDKAELLAIIVILHHIVRMA